MIIWLLDTGKAELGFNDLLKGPKSDAQVVRLIALTSVLAKALYAHLCSKLLKSGGIKRSIALFRVLPKRSAYGARTRLQRREAGLERWPHHLRTDGSSFYDNDHTILHHPSAGPF